MQPSKIRILSQWVNGELVCASKIILKERIFVMERGAFVLKEVQIQSISMPHA
jgi:hypothetical protein